MKGRFVSLGFVCCAVGLLLTTLGTQRAGAQDAALVPLWDPVYHDLAALERLGLVALPGHRPFSRRRVLRLVTHVRDVLASGGIPERARLEASVILDGIEAGRKETGPGARTTTVRLEVGGGRSPERRALGNGIGSVDATLNPLWHGREGAAFGDRWTAALEPELRVALGSGVAVQGGVRATLARSSGDPPTVGVLSVRSLLLRAFHGSVAVEVGRGPVVWGWTDAGGLLLSRNGPPMDRVVIASDVPLSAGLLGELDFALFVADLGETQNFPHAKLFGANAEFGFGPQGGVAFSVLNKQGGQGAPEASFGARFRDLTVLWGLIKGDDLDRFSDKQAAVDLRIAPSRWRGTRFDLSASINDFDRDRLGDVLDATSAVAATVTLPRFGASMRHTVSARVVRTGPLVARHDQFTSGATLDGRLQGGWWGPDAREVAVSYAYRSATPRWSASGEVRVTRFRSDSYAVDPGPPKDIVLTTRGPEEERVGLLAQVRRSDSTRGWEATAGVERVRGAAFVPGATDLNARVSIVLWHRW